jgi:dolichyl-phosphate-mannose-protein mannosyltransferase
MALLIPLITFIFLFLLVIGFQAVPELRKGIIHTFLIFATLTWGITEGLGNLGAIHYEAFTIIWLFIAGTIVLFFKSRLKIGLGLFILKIKETGRLIKSKSTTLKWLLGFIVVFMLLMLLQGLVYPPNNWDSMVYHLSRIAHWISQKNLNHFATSNYREIYQPPFAEYFLLHINVLAKSDLWVNAFQWFCLLLSGITITLILKSFGFNLRYQVIGFFLAVTTPEIVLQASSTQNDIVLSLFILLAFWFALQSYLRFSITNLILFGLSIGFALLTKGTAYIWIAPMGLGWGIFMIMKLIKSRKLSSILTLSIVLIIPFIINSGYYYRNYTLTQHPLGTTEHLKNQYSNDVKNMEVLLSNISRNMALHTTIPYLDKPVYDIVIELHNQTGMDVNDPGTTYNNYRFELIKEYNHEDYAPNPIQFLLILLSFLMIFLMVMLRKKVNPGIITLAVLIIIQFVLFCIYLKWQIWHTRLHTPLFLLSVPLICYLLLKLKRKWITHLILAAIGIYALFILLANKTRPLVYIPAITQEIRITDNRDKKYFTSNPEIFSDYIGIMHKINANGMNIIGLDINELYEYPLFLSIYNRNMQPVHLFVNNVTQILENGNIVPQCIVSVRNQEMITYEDKHFFNTTLNNSTIYLYLPKD